MLHEAIQKIKVALFKFLWTIVYNG